MRRLLIVAAAGLAAVSAGAAGADFDQGIDASSAVRTARRDAAGPDRIGANMMPGSWTPDCADISLEPRDASSRPVTLRSQEWVQQCFPTPGIPGHGGGGQTCVTVPGAVSTERVTVTIDDRKPPLPWEKETFRACLDGYFVSFWTLSGAYKYERVDGGYRGDIRLKPGEKIATRPDPAGLNATLTSWNGALIFNVSDKWAEHYKGDSTVVGLKLLRAGSRSPVYETELTFPTEAVSVSIDFADARNASRLREPLRPGESYRVAWGFKRVGKVSKPDYVRKGDTAPVSYQPAVTAALP